MRSVSAALNRVFLAFFGLIIVCASAWFLASGLDAGHHLPGLSAYLAAAQDQFGAILSPRAHWLVPCGVLASALAFVTGSPSKLWVQADTSVAPDCEVEWTVTELRKQLSEDVATSLGTPPKQLDVLVRLARSVSSTSTSKAVTGQQSPAITGTDA